MSIQTPTSRAKWKSFDSNTSSIVAADTCATTMDDGIDRMGKVKQKAKTKGTREDCGVRETEEKGRKMEERGPLRCGRFGRRLVGRKTGKTKGDGGGTVEERVGPASLRCRGEVGDEESQEERVGKPEPTRMVEMERWTGGNCD